ncbi:hypothetical protein [Pseudomonas lini]
MEPELEDFLRASRAEHEERIFFLNQGLGAETHWFFTQGVAALKEGLYLPACTSFLTGVEASLRNTVCQVDRPARVESLEGVSTLSNKLLLRCREKGLPVELLSFPEEQGFEANLASKQSVEIVRIRHNLCHGNILEFVNTELGEAYAFFTPECCRTVAQTLYEISRRWTVGLGEFRQNLFAGREA